MTDMTELSWDHPRFRRVTETACRAHAGLVLGALKILGIGSTGRPAGPGATCLRCAHPDHRPFDYLLRAAAADQ